MSPYYNKKIIKHHKEAGMTLVVTLLLMLTLTVMASAVLFVVNNHADMTNTVTNKPIAINSADACIEEAIAWAQTTEGKAWLAGIAVTAIDATTGYGTSDVKDIATTDGILYGKTMKTHTKKKTSETRSAAFQNRLDKSSCTSVKMTVIKKTSDESEGSSVSGVGGEIGSEAEYGDEAVAVVIPYKYEILVVAEGIFNVKTLSGGTEIAITGVGRDDPASNWSNSNISKVEVMFSYQE
jgi:Tfp pilus assembly protein PilX